MTRLMMVLSTLMLAACGAASTPAVTTTSRSLASDVTAPSTPVLASAAPRLEVDCHADQISTLWCSADADASASPSAEALGHFRDAAVLVAENTDHALTCRILFGLQNILFCEGEACHPRMRFDIPPDIHDDLVRVEPTLVAACPNFVERQDRQARELLEAYRVDGDTGSLYSANIAVISHHPNPATACDAAEATASALAGGARSIFPSRMRRQNLVRQLTALMALCGSTRTSPTPT